MQEQHESVHLNNKVSFKLAFKDLKYTVKSKIPFVKQETKTILKSISGEFHSSELTAIIGLSGSGKSSLLDCLSGFRVNNISGIITYNDDVISTSKIKTVSSYFMQEQMLHIYLTVNELMNFSVNVKCQKKLSKDEKEVKVEELLAMLDITDRRNDFIQNLSGGERKRLQIAIELVDDPKILFLDEPTTSLDIVASTQCIKFLKDIKEGRMIIFTVHQPSAAMLPMFDHIYAVNAGNCIYQGTSGNLIKFFDELEMPCPSTYNPIDYLMEIANNEYGDHSQVLIDKIQNGSNLDYAKNHDQNYAADIFKKPSDFKESSESYFIQVYYLIMRIVLNTYRDKTNFFMRFGACILLGLLWGIVYQKVGDNAAFSISNFRFITGSVSVVFFISYNSHYYTFPLEFPIIKREHFNGWYSAKAYYTSFLVADIPILFLCTTIFVSIVYYMSNQPLELHRFLLFLGFNLFFAYGAQVLAIMVTSLLKGLLAVILSQFVLMVFVCVSIVGLAARDTLPIFRPFYTINFFNLAIAGSASSVLGMNRTKLKCEEFYCHYSDPKKILHDFECDIDMIYAFYVLLTYFVICHVGAFALIRYKLKYKH